MFIARVTRAWWKASRKKFVRESYCGSTGGVIVQDVETEERGVSWLIVGGGGRQVRQRVGKSRARGSKSNGDWCG